MPSLGPVMVAWGTLMYAFVAHWVALVEVLVRWLLVHGGGYHVGGPLLGFVLGWPLWLHWIGARGIGCGMGVLPSIGPWCFVVV